VLFRSKKKRLSYRAGAVLQFQP